ncbi:MAG: hypothetical protein P8X68_19290 [Desulfobacterales bacterium]
MNDDFKKKLLLLVIDKILFGSIIAIIGISFSLYIEYKYREAEQRDQMLQSVSKVNSDLVVEQRKGLTEWMGKLFKEVSSYAPSGQITEKDLEKLNEITENIEISIYQIDALAPEFSKRELVKSFLHTLIGCNIYLGVEKKLTKPQIMKKLEGVRGAYKKLLEEIGKVSIELAQIDYERVKQ